MRVQRIRRVFRPILLLLTTALLSGCQLGVWLGLDSEPESEVASTPAQEHISQWAATATASSSYGRPDWSPNRATGAPDVTGCTDDARAWASARGNGVEWLELTYNQPVQATEVRIYQTYGRGAVSRVTAIDEEGNAHILWEGEDAQEPCPGVLTVRVDPTPSKVAIIRIDLDESRTAFWNQIDAVELIGIS